MQSRRSGVKDEIQGGAGVHKLLVGDRVTRLSGRAPNKLDRDQAQVGRGPLLEDSCMFIKDLVRALRYRKASSIGKQQSRGKILWHWNWRRIFKWDSQVVVAARGLGRDTFRGSRYIVTHNVTHGHTQPKTQKTRDIVYVQQPGSSGPSPSSVGGWHLAGERCRLMTTVCHRRRSPPW